jgi:hypothetical protein
MLPSYVAAIQYLSLIIMSYYRITVCLVSVIGQRLVLDLRGIVRRRSLGHWQSITYRASDDGIEFRPEALSPIIFEMDQIQSTCRTAEASADPETK